LEVHQDKGLRTRIDNSNESPLIQLRADIYKYSDLCNVHTCTLVVDLSCLQTL